MQKPFVRRFTSKVFLDQAKFPLIANKLFSGTLDPGGNSNGGDREKAGNADNWPASFFRPNRQKAFVEAALTGQ